MAVKRTTRHPTATAQYVGWKQHTCVLCGSVYRYRFARSVTVSRSKAETAHSDAQKMLDEKIASEVDMRPCPNCGLVQPEMIGQKRSDGHAGGCGLAILGAVALGVTWWMGWAHYRTLSFVALAGGFLFTIRHIGISLKNPNTDLDSGRVTAAADVQKGDTVLIEQGQDPGLDSVPTEISPAMKFAFMMLLGSLALFPAAEVLRVCAGWTYNHRASPPVAGPGETIRLYTGNTIGSIKGLWDGTVSLATPMDPALGLGADAFKISTRRESWSGYLNWRSRDKFDSTDLYVEVEVPNVALLQGKTVTLDTVLTVVSPHETTYGKYQNRSQTFKNTLQLAIAAPNSGRAYLMLWWVGMIVGVVFQIAAGYMLSANADKLKKGLPTQLIPI